MSKYGSFCRTLIWIVWKMVSVVWSPWEIELWILTISSEHKSSFNFVFSSLHEALSRAQTWLHHLGNILCLVAIRQRNSWKLPSTTTFYRKKWHGTYVGTYIFFVQCTLLIFLRYLAKSKQKWIHQIEWKIIIWIFFHFQALFLSIFNYLSLCSMNYSSKSLPVLGKKNQCCSHILKNSIHLLSSYQMI